MAIGDTINAALMRFDTSPLERAGLANAQANAAFGNALSMAAKGYFEGQEKKARAKEIEEDLIRNGEDPAAAKAISKNPFLQKEHQRRKATEAQMEIEKNRLAMQAQEIAERSKAASETNMIRQGELVLKKEAQELDIKDANELKESEAKLGRFLLNPTTEEVETPEFKGLLEKFEPDQIPGTPEFRAKELSEPMGARAPIMASYVTNQPGFEMFEERTQPAPGVARLPERFQPEAQAVSDALADGLINEREGLKLLGGIEARAIAEAPEPMSVSDQIRLLEFQKENEPMPPQQPVYMQAALDAIEDALGLIKKDSFYNPVAGFGAEIMTNLGGTDAVDLEAALKTITSSIGFDRLRKMRESSKTGGALGAVSERELEQLNAALGSISQKQSPEQLEKNLKKIRTHYQNSVDALAAQQFAFNNGFQFKTEKQALDFINQYKRRAQASAPASPEVMEAINEKEKQLQRRLLHETPEFKVAGDNQ